MAAIDDLIAQVSDPTLRTRLRAETKKLKDNKPFGLVFEEHLPECTLLYDVPVKKDALVARNGDANDLWTVQSMEGETALCQKYRGKEQETIPVRELTTATEFGTPIFPYLEPLDVVENAPESDLWHTVIEADNYHALQLLEYAYAGKVDCIYIDPPYNTGAKDWKYNNDYVDENDKYRHSKWLSFMKRRLMLAKKLLNPDESVLIVTIDEKESTHLGMLLEEMFPDGVIQMVTSVISAKGVVRQGQFARVEENIYFIMIGNASIAAQNYNMLDDTEKAENRPIEWLGLRRREPSSKRGSRPNQFYPIFVDEATGYISEIGEAVPDDVDRNSITVPKGKVAIWPLDSRNREGLWGLTPDVARNDMKKGYLHIKRWDFENKKGTVYYLPSGTLDDIDDGKVVITGREKDGAIIGYYKESGTVPPKRVWNQSLHNAETYGTKILSKMLGDGGFSYPKSLYAVCDCLKFATLKKKDALIVDFFAGSGTTLHAANLLNADDGGHRRCILVTNNEVSYDEEEAFKAKGLKPGDAEWDKFGIARCVTWPRTKCSILGQDIHGKPLNDKKDVYITSQTIESMRGNSRGFI